MPMWLSQLVASGPYLFICDMLKDMEYHMILNYHNGAVF